MKRFTDTDLWDKEWFMSLSMKHKLFIQFIFSKCDQCGVWSPNWILASSYIGDIVNIDDAKLLSNQVEVLPDGKIWVIDFCNFQYGELTEKSPPHRKVIGLLKKHQLYNRVLLGYCRGSNTPQEKEKEEDKDKEEEKESKPQKFIPPTLDMVKAYFEEKGYLQEIAVKAFNHYHVADWKDTQGKPVKNWKQKMNTNWFEDKHKKHNDNGTQRKMVW